MHTGLYLDTARLGRMCKAARKAEQHFAKLASQSGSSLYFERFLTGGFHSLPRRLRRDVSHLRSWAGICGLKQQLRQFVGLRETCPVLLAARSVNLMTLAAHCLFRRCRNVMTTDAEWPPYLAILRRVAIQNNGQVTVVPLGQSLLHHQPTQRTVVDRLARAYESSHCDGIFLSDITFFGIRIPVRELIARLRKSNTHPPFVVVDGAQALNHAPLQLTPTYCDIYLTGTHKWLQAYLPLGVACCCDSSSVDLIKDTISKCRHDGLLGDPLLDFCFAAEREDFQTFGETINLTPLITAAAALARARQPDISDRWVMRQANVHRVIDILSRTPWVPVRVCDTMRTAALLVRAKSKTTQAVSPRDLRIQFHRKLVCLTAYGTGFVRVSIPSIRFSAAHFSTIQRAFAE